MELVPFSRKHDPSNGERHPRANIPQPARPITPYTEARSPMSPWQPFRCTSTVFPPVRVDSCLTALPTVTVPDLVPLEHLTVLSNSPRLPKSMET